MLIAAVCLSLASANPSTATAASNIPAILQTVADAIHTKFNISVAIAFLDSRGTAASAASGYTDAGLNMGYPSRRAKPDDIYVWGSTTKMFTAAAVMQLVDQGLVNLDDSAASHIDPFLLKMNGTRLSDLLGKKVDKVLVRHLLHMSSSIQDYDRPAYTRAQFQNKSHDFSPIEQLSWFVPPIPWWSPASGSRQRYCSTNYILLGLLLANYRASPSSFSSGPDGWKAYDQKSVVPSVTRHLYANSTFALEGACSKHTVVHGFMESYQQLPSLPPQDTWNVSCLGGWTAGNYLGPAMDVARFGLELYRKGGTIVSAARQAEMIDFHMPGQQFGWYGMGTFNLNWTTASAAAYGHVGDTYGYQSSVTYVPDLDATFSVGTDAETSTQGQPADATCRAYNMVKAALSGKKRLPTCEFVSGSHFIGECKCKEDSTLDEMLVRGRGGLR